MVFDNPEFDGHERVAFATDAKFGLQAIHATHRKRHGVGAGGIRMRSYPTAKDALTDALRLSRAMTYKFVLADLPAGGAKTVVIGDPATDKTRDLLKAPGRYIEDLHGAYLGGPDVGTNGDDMAVIGEETSYVAGRSNEPGSTAVPIALGVVNGMRAVANFAFGGDDPNGVSVAVQGSGGVGSRVCGLLADAGAHVVVADVNADAAASIAEKTGTKVVDAQEILFVDADILSPCALGAILNEQNIPRLKARAICGAANNQLATKADGERLKERGISFVPDYVVSSGGAIGGFHELGYIDAAQRDQKLAQIYDTTLRTLELARRDSVSTEVAAQNLAVAILETSSNGASE